MLMKRKSNPHDDSAERMALSVLAWLASDDEHLQAFMAATGLTPDTLRASAQDPGFLTGVLDHVMGNEATLVSCATALDVPPERIAAAWRKLGPPEPDDDFA
jgi:hypothetical protein